MLADHFEAERNREWKVATKCETVLSTKIVISNNVALVK